MGWKTLQAVRYRESPASGEFSLPPVSRHGLVLTIRPAERLEVRYEGVRLDRPPAAGSINVIPAGSSVLWRRERSMDALFVNLEPSLVARVAAESFGFDTSRPVLPPLYGLNLPELPSLRLALEAELRTGGLGGSLLVESVANVLAVHLIRYITGPGRLKAAADERSSSWGQMASSAWPRLRSALASRIKATFAFILSGSPASRRDGFRDGVTE